MASTLLSTVLLALGAMLLLAGCRPVVPRTQDAAAAAPQRLVVETANAEDVLTVTSAGNQTIVEIVSPHGIGRAQVQFPPEAAANPVLLRFHLKGLEQAVFDNGRDSLSIAVSSHPPYAVSQALQTGDGVTQLEQGTPRWASVQMVAGDDATPAIPLQTGYIEIRLPPNFIDAENPSLALEWIDFYR